MRALNNEVPGPGGKTGASVGARVLAIVAAAALTLTAMIIGPTAMADTAPADPNNPASPVTVSADGLPTTQIDGVAWKQVVVGNTVYVAGNFQTARPAGSAPGSNTVPRKNILAYDIRTGNLINGFAPSLNAQALAITASPDGSRIYVAGSFTQVNGVNAYRIAALDPVTGQLIASFQPQPNATVTSIVATNTTVFAGGWFSGVGSTPRGNLAAFRATDGGLLPWNPATSGGTIEAMAIAPSHDKLVVGGSFTGLNGSSNPGYGMGIVDATTGALQAFPANNLIRNGGTEAAILSLVSSDDQIYGTGYVFGNGGNLEGTFSANWSDGAIKWVEDCHGDTYGAYPVDGTVYTAGHAHFCGTVGGFPQTEPQWDFYRGIAFTEAVTGTLGTNPYGGYYNFAGTPAPTLLNWFPDMDEGTFTGRYQGPWTVQGNGDYVVYGGEFLHVNGVAQQGLVRYAKPSIAPNKQGPMVAGAATNPTVRSVASGTALINWQENWDRDNATLRYDIIRDGDINHPVYSTSTTANFWNRSGKSFMDTGLAPGSTHGYRVFTTDPFGNVSRSETVNVTVATTGTLGAYATSVFTDGASNYWRLDETSGSTVVDWAGTSNLSASSGVSRGAAGALVGDPNKASTFSGSSTGSASTATATPGKNQFTAEAWFKTTTKRGGKILGFGSSKTGNSSSYDRQVYMANDGKLIFGVYPGSVATVQSTAKYNDGAWHHVVASLGSNGMTLYVDGAAVDQRADITFGQAYSGYWRVGGDNLSSWPSAPSSNYFSGVIDEVAIYPSVLTAAAVANHYSKGAGIIVNVPPVAAFTSTATDLAVAVDAATSSDSDGTIASYSWDWGDGSPTGTGVTASHSYATAGSYTVNLTVTDDKGATNVVTKNVIVTAPNVAPVAAFTATATDANVAVDAGASTDSDGTIASYSWDWGDGSPAGTGVTASHSYAASGSYSVTLTVTDNKGATNVLAKDVTVTLANIPPVAAFTATSTGLDVGVDAAGSTDSDGTIGSYSWAWGDGSPAGTGVNTSHSYAAAGTYSVTLTVTDNQGATNVLAKDVTVALGNVAPVAAFTATATDLNLAVDGATSTDSDGTIASYSWDWGDSSPAGTGATATHNYAAAGTYSVTLTVTDNQGATNALAKDVTVTAPEIAVVASDSFNRTVSNGMGNADLGGPWTIDTGRASSYSVAGGIASVINGPGLQPSLALQQVTAASTDTTLAYTLSNRPGAGALYLSVQGRMVGSSNDYRAKISMNANGSIGLTVSRYVSGAETILSGANLTGQTFTAGTKMHLRLVVTGTNPTTIKLKVWQDGNPEPAAWQLTSTDSTAALQTAGGVGMLSYLSGSAGAPVTVKYEAFTVKAAQ